MRVVFGDISKKLEFNLVYVDLITLCSFSPTEIVVANSESNGKVDVTTSFGAMSANKSTNSWTRFAMRFGVIGVRSPRWGSPVTKEVRV